MPLADFFTDTFDRYRDTGGTTTDIDGVPVTTPDPAPVTIAGQFRRTNEAGTEVAGTVGYVGRWLVAPDADIAVGDRIDWGGIGQRVVSIESFVGFSTDISYLQVNVTGVTR